MGTAQTTFAVVLCGGVTGSEVTWPEVTSVTCPVRKYAMCMRNRKLRNIRPSGAFLTGSDVSYVTGALSGRMFCACATGSCAISALIGHFWSEVSHVTGRGPVRKGPWPKVCSAHARLFSVFFLSSTVVTWLPDVTEGHLTPSGFPWMCNRKLCNTRRSRDPFGSVLGVFSRTSASYDHRKPRVLYLAWLLELALVIFPFYFHIVSI